MTEVQVNQRGEGFPEKAEYEKIRNQGRQRIIELSKPKKIQREWWTNVGPDVPWGTQEMMWPLKDTAKRAKASRRVTELASPKRNFQAEKENNKSNAPLFFYSCGRSSPIFDTADGARKVTASARVEQLATPKRDFCNHKDDVAQFFYSCGRTSPVTVPEKVQGAERPRTTMLAAHKSSHLTAREIQTIIPPPALKAKISERVEALANPKDRPIGPYRESQWTVSDSAKNAAASTRSMELARPKGLVEGFLPHKETVWPVTRAARRATATNRLNELSQPTVRTSMDHLQFNPEAFIVKPTALKGTCPRRVDELSQPIQR